MPAICAYLFKVSLLPGGIDIFCAWNRIKKPENMLSHTFGLLRRFYPALLQRDTLFIKIEGDFCPGFVGNYF